MKVGKNRRVRVPSDEEAQLLEKLFGPGLADVFRRSMTAHWGHCVLPRQCGPLLQSVWIEVLHDEFLQGREKNIGGKCLVLKFGHLGHRRLAAFEGLVPE